MAATPCVRSADFSPRLAHRLHALSPGEPLCRVLPWHLDDLPAPLTNISILDHEVDAYWPPQRLVVEMDSWEFHSHRAAFEEDRARDAAMQAAGYRVIRLTHRQLDSEAPRIATQLRKLLGPDQPRSM